MAASKALPLTLLAGTLALAIQSMWIFSQTNGYFDMIKDTIEVGPRVLPLTDLPLKTSYTGIVPLDRTLTVLQLFFANVVDGKTEGGSLLLKLFVVQFIGTLGAVYLVLCVEGAKKGGGIGQGLIVMITGLTIQAFGYGIAMPIYCIFHLALSWRSTPPPTFTPSIYASLKGLPFSLILGYIVPTTLMCLPNRPNDQHQTYVAIWQFFPVWMFLAHTLYSTLYRLISPRSTAITLLEKRDILGEVYLFAVVFGILSHFTSLYLLFGPKYFPEFMPAFWPKDVQNVSVWDVFVPPNPFGKEKITDVTMGPLAFLQFDEYVGSTAVAIWALTLKAGRKGGLSGGLVGELAMLVVKTVVMGPGAAIVTLMWAKDDKEVVEQETKAKKSL